MRVAIFTDNDFDKINGVTTTLKALLRHAPDDVSPRVYTFADFGIDTPEYLALASIGVPIPFYGEMQMYLPRLRELRRRLRADGVRLIHLTTPAPPAWRHATWRVEAARVWSAASTPCWRSTWRR